MPMKIFGKNNGNSYLIGASKEACHVADLDEGVQYLPDVDIQVHCKFDDFHKVGDDVENDPKLLKKLLALPTMDTTQPCIFDD